MVATLMDGSALARQIRDEIQTRVAALRERGCQPTLATILVGNDPNSAGFVRSKQRACQQVGIQAVAYHLSDTAPQSELETLIDLLNQNAHIHGILVQLPLPSHLQAVNIADQIARTKDVDGLRRDNLGAIALPDRPALFIPPTALGCLRLLQAYDAPIAGANVVVVGRSALVGLPLSLLLLAHHATVTICHHQTQGLAAHCRNADILITAAGQPNLVCGDAIKPGAYVVDVGLTRQLDQDGKGYWVGDVNATEAAAIASYLTPVPGGVGPLTIALLLENVVQAAELATERVRH